jgi:hypothetical protein
MAMGETLQDILTRLEARLFATPAVDSPVPSTPTDRQMISPGDPPRFPQDRVRALLTMEAQDIPAEVFLENLGFFTPSSKRIRGIYTKEKIVGTRVAADGTTRLITTKISANHELGLPITADLDYYRAFTNDLTRRAENLARGRFESNTPRQPKKRRRPRRSKAKASPAPVTPVSTPEAEAAALHGPTLAEHRAQPTTETP